MLGWLRRRRLARRAEELLPGRAEFDALCRGRPAFERLDATGREQLRRRTAWVLAAKEFHGAGGLQPEWHHCLAVAAHAALPLLSLETAWYDGFRSFILYADAFEVEIDEVDEHGLAHRGRDLRAGEAWELGPVVLSMTDVEESGRGEGYNVVIHEIAHQLDQLNGEANGFPPLQPGMTQQAWSSTMTEAFQRLVAALDRGEEPGIDDYAAESPAEFFAVVSEYFFDAPEHLRVVEPAVYRQLALLYRQQPSG